MASALPMMLAMVAMAAAVLAGPAARPLIAKPATVRIVGGGGLRRDNVDVVLVPAIKAEFAAQLGGKPSYPFKSFSAAFVKKALATPTDWRRKRGGWVTPAKDQGAHVRHRAP